MKRASEKDSTALGFSSFASAAAARASTMKQSSSRSSEVMHSSAVTGVGIVQCF